MTEQAKKLRAALMKTARPRYGATATAECGRIFDAAYDTGYGDGLARGRDFAVDECLTGFILAVHDCYGWTTEQLAEVLEAVKRRMMDEFSLSEAKEKCRELGITITEG